MRQPAPTYYDRRVPPALLDALDLGGVLHGLIERRDGDPLALDVQLRATPTATGGWVSLYLGLTTILDAVLTPKDRFRLRAHPTHQERGGFDPAWTAPATLSELTGRWPKVDAYLDRVIPAVDPHHLQHEGRVHGAICSGRARSYRVLDREAAIGFRRDKESICLSLQRPIQRALASAGVTEPWWPGVRRPMRNLGTGLDILALDTAGRLIVMEAKPANATLGISLAPMQVRFYAELFALWLGSHADALAVLQGLLAQRTRLGLSRPGPPTLAEMPTVVPVIAIGAGDVNPTAMSRLHKLADALVAEPTVSPDVSPVEIWHLDSQGEPRSIEICG